jgi:uncharacterized protein YyaL (SSP411 family)
LNPTRKLLPAIFGDAPRRCVATSSYRGGWWKSILALVAIVCIISPRALAAQSEDGLPAHALKASASLYLREAEGSAIRWQRWGPETFALARKLNRPMIIDIGAVWCHWCHVMDQTTYADPEVAAELNRNFVPVKVDTDERPDIDAYYQSAAARLTGAGGWPLTCFTTSDGALFFAAGYLPPRPGTGPNGSGGETSSMAPLLKRIAHAYATDRTAIEHEAVATAAKLKADVSRDQPVAGGFEAMRAQTLAGLAASYDRESGGFAVGPGPRFYDFPAIELALAHGFFGHPDFTAMALDTLRKISGGGVFDQLGGGFHRYSTDPQWRVPHFEKLGYDNAMGLRAYCDAYEASGDEEFARVARSIAGYVNRELLDPKTHAFYSHQDADSFKGDDGSYYTWTVEEVRRALPADQARVAILYFGMQDSPALAPDGRIVLRRAIDSAQIASRLKLSDEQVRAMIAKAQATMLAARLHRRLPQVDRAVMTDRNALMADAYLTASAALDDQSLKHIALDDLDFILAHMRARDGSVYHVWSDGRAQVAGLVADQVYLLNALIDAYQFSGEEKYLAEARSLAAVILKKFRAPGSGVLVNLSSADNGPVIAQSAPGAQVFYDMPMPSVQATMSIATAKLGLLTGDDSYTKRSSELLADASMAKSMMSSAVATLGLALEDGKYGDAVVAIVGSQSDSRAAGLLKTALASYRPGKIVTRIESSHGVATGLPPAAQAMVAASAGEASPLAFVCAGTACATPVRSPEKLANVIRQFGVSGSGKQTLANDRQVPQPPPM